MSRSIRECIRWRVSTAKRPVRWNSIMHFTWDSLWTVPYLPAGAHAQHDSLAWVSFSGGAYQRGSARPPTNCRASCLTSGLTAPLRCLAPSVHNKMFVCVISFNHSEPEGNACVFFSFNFMKSKFTWHSTRGQGTQCCAQSHPGQCLQVTSMANRLTRATEAMMTRAGLLSECKVMPHCTRKRKLSMLFETPLAVPFWGNILRGPKHWVFHLVHQNMHIQKSAPVDSA